MKLGRVGVATLRDPALFSAVSQAFSGHAGAPSLVLAPSIQALRHLESLSTFFRVYSWFSPLPPTRAQTWTIGPLLAQESQVQNALERTDAAFRLSGPDDVVTGAQQRGQVSAHRLVLVGGETSALLLGFAVIAAIGLRRGLAAEQRRRAGDSDRLSDPR